MSEDFLQAYFEYIGPTEAPMVFHRWSCLAVLGAWIGRDRIFKFGHFNIKPNIYCMLMGNAGSRKTTAIKIAAKLVKQAGYANVSADKTTKEKFLLDLAGEEWHNGQSNAVDVDILEKNIFGPAADMPTHIPEILIAADEFNTFVGNGNIEFLSMLGVLWDHEGAFENKVKNSKSVKLDNPYVNILAGNTPTGFSLAFPAEAIGQGIFSRLILVHGEATGRKITFPQAPTKEATNTILSVLHEIKKQVSGEIPVSMCAEKLLDAIYKSPESLSKSLDIRFEAYINRRFTHLIKLCLIVSAASFRNTIEESDVVYANTILTHTEHSMGKALGEFGKAKHSDINHKIVQILENSYEPVVLKTLWTQVHNDLEDIHALKDILSNLITADKVISTKVGFLAKRKVLEEVNGKFVDFNLLTEEERKYVQ
jgi:hypothetical protein